MPHENQNKELDIFFEKQICLQDVDACWNVSIAFY